MRIIHTTTWFLSLVAALGAGCSHPSTGAVQPPATPTAGATGPAAVENAKQKREEMDPAHALFQAARDQQLHPDQTTKVLGLERQLESNERETVPAFQTFHADLAAQVRAGQIDRTKMQADEAAIESALQRHIAKESETLGGLHDAIDPAQRRATVASVRAKEPAMPEEQARMGYGGGPQDVAKRKLDLMTSDLGLDEAQQQQVAKWVSEQSGSMRPMYEERRKRRDALFDAFESSTFNANALAPSSLGAEVRMHLDEHVAFLSKLVPILRTEQREKLASMIEGRGLGGDHDQD